MGADKLRVEQRHGRVGLTLETSCGGATLWLSGSERQHKEGKVNPRLEKLLLRLHSLSRAMF